MEPGASATFNVVFVRPRPPSRFERHFKLLTLWLGVTVAVVLMYIYVGYIFGFVVAFILAIFATWFTWRVLTSATPEPAGVHVLPAVSVPVNGGLSRHEIEVIPAFAYHRSRDQDGSGAGSSGWAQCAVCISSVREGELVRQLPACKHMFHVRCIDAWLAAQSTCPMCRSDVKTGEASAHFLPPV